MPNPIKPAIVALATAVSHADIVPNLLANVVTNNPDKESTFGNGQIEYVPQDAQAKLDIPPIYTAARSLLQKEEINATETNSSQIELPKKCLSTIKSVGFSEEQEARCVNMTIEMINSFSTQEREMVYKSLAYDDRKPRDIHNTAIMISEKVGLTVEEIEDIIYTARKNKGSNAGEIVSDCVTPEFKDHDNFLRAVLFFTCFAYMEAVALAILYKSDEKKGATVSIHPSTFTENNSEEQNDEKPEAPSLETLSERCSAIIKNTNLDTDKQATLQTATTTILSYFSKHDLETLNNILACKGDIRDHGLEKAAALIFSKNIADINKDRAKSLVCEAHDTRKNGAAKCVSEYLKRFENSKSTLNTDVTGAVVLICSALMQRQYREEKKEHSIPSPRPTETEAKRLNPQEMEMVQV